MGQFVVVVGGRLIFSKKQAGRFPGAGEVEERVAQFKAGKEFPEAARVGGYGGLMGRLLAKLLG
jgi:predicted Rdx family selenoprotein